MNTKLATALIRVKNWAAIIQDRNESGLSVKDYCAQHQLSRDSYYYWLRKGAWFTIYVKTRPEEFQKFHLTLSFVSYLIQISFYFHFNRCNSPCICIFSNPFCLNASYSTMETEFDRFKDRISPHIGIRTQFS